MGGAAGRTAPAIPGQTEKQIERPPRSNMAGALFRLQLSRFASIAYNRACMPLICAEMKLYHNNVKGRYNPLQSKTNHNAPARVNCQALVFVRVRCYHAARAGYADRDDAHQDRRRPRRHPRRARRPWADHAGDGPLRRGRCRRAWTGAGGRPVKSVLLRPFCDFSCRSATMAAARFAPASTVAAYQSGSIAPVLRPI